jgi:predicted nucleic acid-binding protein
MQWRNAQEPNNLLITTVTLGEVWQGFYALDISHRDYDRIKAFAANLAKSYTVLNFDQHAAAVWGELVARSNGPLPMRDSFIAAIVRSRGHRIVTRDVEVFERMGCRVVSPWT